MKKTLALVGITACSFIAQSGWATPYDTNSRPVELAKTKAKQAAVARAPKRAVYYITSVGATGSHLPLVVCRYKGEYYSQSPTTVYGQPQLDRTGQLTVVGELYQRDPAVSSAGVRR